MGLKAIIALFLGLVIQFSQVQSGLAAAVSSCGDMEKPMSCCTGPKSCPCVSERSQEQKPAPIISSAMDLKWFATRHQEPERFIAAVSQTEVPVVIPTHVRENSAGHEGVRLSVSFCSFVI